MARARRLHGGRQVFSFRSFRCARERALSRRHRSAAGRRHLLPLPVQPRLAARRHAGALVSAIAQGAALSLFARLFKLTKDPAWSRAADRTFESFRTPRNETQPWTAFVDRGRLWFEEYPSQEPEQVLNGHLFALFGVYDYARATKKRAAQDVFDGGATTVRDEVGRFRVPGGSSYYNLRDLGGTLKYHDIVVGQLQLLARMTGDRFFAHEAALFHRDAH